ncbi:MAG TPA: DUF1592 domain-containing protein [Polyangiaceae bacterium]
MRRIWALLTPTLLLAFTAGCSSTIDADGPGDSAGSGSGPTGPTAGRGGGSTGGTGTVAGSGGTGSGTTGGTTGNSGGTTGGAGSPPGISGSPSTADCPQQAVPPTPVRRLTRTEYANSVQDLLNVDPTPAKDLPADEVTGGFDNRASILTVSPLHAEKYVFVSEELARSAVLNLAALTGNCNTAQTGEEACAQQFAQSFGRRAFRRELTANDTQALMTAYQAGATGGSYAEGIEVMIRAALQSPDFLYRLETTTPANPSAALVPLSQFELATRLSYLLWASGPDDALLDAAAAGQLGTRDAVASKAREMLASPKAHRAVANFFGQWTSTNRLDIITKQSDIFPSFTADVKAAMKAELPAFLDYVLWTGDRTLATLLTAPIAFVTPALAQLYGVTAPPGSESTPQRVDLPANQGRAGILTQAGFLSVQGHPDQTSPVLRGKFVRAMLLCDPPSPPPDDVNIMVPEVDPNATARERFGAHLTAGNTCNGCHSAMDPIGLAFEHFDAMGVYRELDGGKVIDVSGEIFDADDPSLAGEFVGVPELAQKLAGSDQVRDCMAMQLFRFASGRSEGQADSCSIGTIQETFASANGDIMELLVSITQSDSFWYRTPVTP